jgi:hypothetical protein
VRLRKYIFGAAALALASGTLVVALSGGSASASVNPPTVQANGTASCGNAATGSSGLSGSITFTPPLVNGGTAAEVTKVSIKLKHCTTTATNLAHGGILTGKVKATISSPTSTNDCAGLGTSAQEILTVKWTYKSSSGVVLDIVKPTTITYSGYNPVTSAPPWPATGDEGFQLPGNGSGGGGTSSMTSTSSFQGTDHGATSTAVAFLSFTAAQFTTACSGSGEASATFVDGASKDA